MFTKLACWLILREVIFHLSLKRLFQRADFLDLLKEIAEIGLISEYVVTNIRYVLTYIYLKESLRPKGEWTFLFIGNQ